MAGNDTDFTDMLVEALEYLRSTQTGYVTDALTRLHIGDWMSDLLPLTSIGDTSVAGQAFTIKFSKREDGKYAGLEMYKLLREAPRGAVIVIEGGHNGFTMGENMVTTAREAGVRAIVLDGYVRDIHAIRELAGIEVFCRGPMPRHLTGYELTAHNVAVDCGGATVHPGDVVVGDDDGLVVVPVASVQDVVRQVRDIAELEQEQSGVITSHGSLDELRQVLQRKKRVV